MQSRLDTYSIARQLLDPNDPRLRALYRKNAFRTTAALARCWMWIAAALAFAALQPGPVVYAIAFVVIGTQQYALSILSHEGKHRNLFTSVRVNDWAGLWLTSAPLGTDFARERRIHLDHHSRLGDDDDPDRDLYRAEDKSEFVTFLLYLSGLTTLPGARRRVTEINRRSLPYRLFRLVRQRWASIPAQIVILSIFVFALEWWLYIPLWIAPLFFLMLIPQRIRQFCEHAQATLPDQDADPHRLVTYRAGPVERMFLGPFNMGYHAEHHLWHAVPWYRLPELAGIIPENGSIEIRGGYLQFLIMYFRKLPLDRTVTA